MPGDLVVGDLAYDAWARTKLDTPPALDARALPAAYLEFAENALSLAGAGSSAAGEFPKFTARRALAGAATPHVIVKFSGAGQAAGERRWADLLVCEHLALQAAMMLPGVAGARSRIVEAGGRTFIEVERFDRVGAFGRLPTCSLDDIVPAFLGASTTAWPELAARLQGLGLVTAGDVRGVTRLWWYGRMIANTDMHLGNLSFHVHAQGLSLAPVYDMLPMHYAPLPGGEVPRRSFDVVPPRPAEQAAWQEAARAAAVFWSTAASDPRISEAFREIAHDHAARVGDALSRV
jgi:serine/threonine protein kinase HipA of HipAB toxin-antitoxin module